MSQIQFKPNMDVLGTYISTIHCTLVCCECKQTKSSAKICGENLLSFVCCLVGVNEIITMGKANEKMRRKEDENKNAEEIYLRIRPA